MGEIASLLPLIQGTTAAAGAYGEYEASNAQGRYRQRAGNINAQLALRQGEDATRIGEDEAQRRLRQGGQDASSERVRLAAQGVNVNTGSAARTQQDIANAAGQDAATIRKNAAMQSWGYGVDAINSKAGGKMARTAGRYQGTQSLISGGMQFARYGLESYNESQKNKKPDQEDYFPNRPG